VPEVTVNIDGEQVRLTCSSLTVREFNDIARLGYRRGSLPHPVDRDLVMRRITSIDQHVEVKAGITVDEEPLTKNPATFFAAREDVVGTLFFSLLNAQQASEEERSALKIAARFSLWLDKQDKKEATSHWVQTGINCGKCMEADLCKKRGCDDKEQRRPVWHDRDLILNKCPILSFTPKVEEALRLFYLSHEIVGIGMSVMWQQRTQIKNGNLEDQDAWMESALGCLRTIHNEALRAQAATPKTPKKVTK